MAQYIRHALAPLDAIIPEIMAQWDKSTPRMEYGAWSFNIYSLRLRTFCRAAYKNRLECSNCKLRAEYFAVESFARNSVSSSVHVNLYGRKEDGEEVLFTHDHTLARALGGVDDLSNTTVMCYTCNNKKGQVEAREVNVKRAMETMSAKAKSFQQMILDAKKNPTPTEQVGRILEQWSENMSSEDFAKRIDTFLQTIGWKRKLLKEKINSGEINFILHPVRD